jgi:hypothetical protein
MLLWIKKIFTSKKIFVENPLNKYLYLLVIIAVCAIFLKEFSGGVFKVYLFREIINFKNWVDALILFFILINILDEQKSVRATIFGLMCLLAVTSVTTPLIANDIVKIGYIATAKEYAGRSAAFGDVNTFASYLVLFIPLVFTYFLFSKNLISKLIYALLLGSTLLALVTTGSRGGMISLLIAISIYLYFLHGQRVITLPTIYGIIALFIVIGSITFMLAPKVPKEILLERSDFNQLEKGMDYYTAGRTKVLREGLLLFSESPIYGHGAGTFMPLMKMKYGIAIVSHNAYLTYLVETGIVGFLLYLIILVKIFKFAWKNLNFSKNVKDKLFYISYLSGFCGYYFSLLGVNEQDTRYIIWIYTAVLFKYQQSESIS